MRDKALNDPRLQGALPPNMVAIIAGCGEVHPARLLAVGQQPQAPPAPLPPAGDPWGNWNPRHQGRAASTHAASLPRPLDPTPWAMPDGLPILPTGSPRDWPKHSLVDAVRHFRRLGPDAEARWNAFRIARPVHSQQADPNAHPERSLAQFLQDAYGIRGAALFPDDLLPGWLDLRVGADRRRALAVSTVAQCNRERFIYFTKLLQVDSVGDPSRHLASPLLGCLHLRSDMVLRER